MDTHDAFLGYSLSSANMLTLLQAYNALLSFVQDKWQGVPRSILGNGHEVVSAAVLTPYWQHGISHHVQLIIAAQKVSVWGGWPVTRAKACAGRTGHLGALHGFECAESGHVLWRYGGSYD